MSERRSIIECTAILAAGIAAAVAIVVWAFHVRHDRQVHAAHLRAQASAPAGPTSQPSGSASSAPVLPQAVPNIDPCMLIPGSKVNQILRTSVLILNRAPSPGSCAFSTGDGRLRLAVWADAYPADANYASEQIADYRTVTALVTATAQKKVPAQHVSNTPFSAAELSEMHVGSGAWIDANGLTLGIAAQVSSGGQVTTFGLYAPEGLTQAQFADLVATALSH